MGVHIRKNRGKLYLDVYVSGKREWEALHLTMTSDRAQNREIMRLAETMRSRREMQIASGEWGLIGRTEAAKTLYKAMEEADSPAASKCLKHLKEFGGENVKLREVTPAWLNRFYGYLKGKVKASSAKCYSQGVKKALHRAVRDGILARNPADGADTIRVPESDMVFLSPQEVAAMSRHECGGKNGADVKRAFLFACFTGLRVSDLITLKWGDIETDTRQIIHRMKKNGKVAYIPLSETAWGLIHGAPALHRVDAPVFPGIENNDTASRDRLNEWARKAGVRKHIGWHTARRTFATTALESGADIYTVSKLLVHANVATTQVYAKATDKLKRAAVNAMPGLG